VARGAVAALEFQGPAAVLAVLLLEIAVGSLAVLVLSPVWDVVKRGYFLLVGWTVGVCAVLAALAAPDRSAAMMAFAGHAVLLVVLLHMRKSAVASAVGGAFPTTRVFGAFGVVVGALALVEIAQERASGRVGGALAVLAGAAFLGATWNGMVLGHWYLVDRKLTVDPMRWHAWAFTAGIALALVSAALAKGGEVTGAETSLNPLLLVSDLTLYLAFGLVAVNALLSFFVHKLVNEGSIRAATGMLYLAVIMALSAEFAAKARFFTV